eukprot:2123295-Amphidinium_carterae.1
MTVFIDIFRYLHGRASIEGGDEVDKTSQSLERPLNEVRRFQATGPERYGFGHHCGQRFHGQNVSIQ